MVAWLEACVETVPSVGVSVDGCGDDCVLLVPLDAAVVGAGVGVADACVTVVAAFVGVAGNRVFFVTSKMNKNEADPFLHSSFEPQHQQTYLGTCAPSEDSDQPGHSAVGSELLPRAFWVAKDSKFVQTDKEGSDQTTQIRRLI